MDRHFPHLRVPAGTHRGAQGPNGRQSSPMPVRRSSSARSIPSSRRSKDRLQDLLLKGRGTAVPEERAAVAAVDERRRVSSALGAADADRDAAAVGERRGARMITARVRQSQTHSAVRPAHPPSEAQEGSRSRGQDRLVEHCESIPARAHTQLALRRLRTAGFPKGGPDPAWTAE
jgi:hypothetical protein